MATKSSIKSGLRTKTTKKQTDKKSEVFVDKKSRNFKYYQNKAIDFSKRNRLLKFPARATSIEFIVPLEDCASLFGNLAELQIDLVHKEILKQDDVQETLLELPAEEPEFPLPETNVFGKKLIAQLDKLRLQAKNNFDSHGLHTLFLSVGEIRWKEQLAGRGSAEAVTEWDYIAPLLLIPVEIANQKAPQKKSVIKLNEELYDIQINPVLDLFIKQNLEVKLPSGLPANYTDFDWEEIDSILKKYQKIFKEDKGLECSVTSRIRLGQYTFHGQQIYEDLTRNEDSILDHDFVSSLCGDDQITQSSDAIDADDEDSEIDDFLTEEEDFTILDADESQLKSIKSAMGGNHLVIHGPPGTGKSQTIANLISNLLARGKKVLFVCEKQVALDVVYNRLKTRGADISDLCLPLFQYTADKKMFAKSIIDSRNRIVRALESTSTDSVNRKLVERKDRMDKLEAYSSALLSSYGTLNKTAYWIHGELARVAPHVEGAVLPWREKKTTEIDHSNYQRLVTTFTNLSDFKDEIFNANNHWSGIKQDSFSPDYSSRLFAKLNELSELVSAFPKLENSTFGVPKNIEAINTTLLVADQLDMDELLSNKLIATERINSETLNLERKSLTTIKELIEEYHDTATPSDKYEVPTDWTPKVFEGKFFKGESNLSKISELQSTFLFAKEKITTLKTALKKSKHSTNLLSLDISSIKKYKNLFYTDPIVQKIKDWDSRIALYEVQNELKKINDVYKRLLEAQEVLNEWSISSDEIDKESFWDLEHRFATKYKYIFRVFYSSYKTDVDTVTKWCAASRPRSFKQYREIISALADKIRLKDKYETMMGVFIKNNATDKTLKSVSLEALTGGVAGVLSYLEEAQIDKLSEEIKILVTSTENLDCFRQIISLVEDLSSQIPDWNSGACQDFLSENQILSDVLKLILKCADEAEELILLSDGVNQYLTSDVPATLIDLEREMAILTKLESICKQITKADFQKHTGKSSIRDLLQNTEALDAQSAQLESVLKIIGDNSLSKSDFYKDLDSLNTSIDSWKDWSHSYSDLKNDLEVLMNNTDALISFEAIDIEEFATSIKEMVVDSDGLERWIKYQKIRGQIQEWGMTWFIEDIQKNKIDRNLGDVFVWSFLNKILSEIYKRNDVLKNFNISDYTRYVAEFKKLEKQVFEANQYRVLENVYPNIRYAMNRGGNSERTIVRESQKIMRHLPIRKLVTENAEHILSYKPCWMMSPLTLSSYIPYGSVEFDVVIFDEASQMKIENAIGSIARAKQVIVIGDEHQLPPTSFFDVSSEDDEDEDLEEIGYESILQSAITILPGAESYLTYHYRSKHSDLIAFSNAHIYQNLVIFPSPKNYDAVRFEFVENGIYDAGKTRSNRIEALRVAELCIQHFESNTSSLGVIAFSKAQEEAIRDTIREKIKDYPHLADKFDETLDVRNQANEDSSFFIRNLESVQGDERDVIVLSVGYGPDQNGNVYNRFGPLNSKGGYRRLNVAVTRAREQIICVSSMKFHQMSPSEGTRGAVLLQKYLEFAEKGRTVLDASKIVNHSKAGADSDFEVSVQSAIESLGYTVSQQVGAAGFSIDLAIINPKNKNEYILGIECDGAAYHSSKSARIRDRLRQEILERLGWKIYRVWSQHWINHRQEILDDIVRVANLNE